MATDYTCLYGKYPEVISGDQLYQMLRQLPQLRQVYLCLDNDKAGHAASERMEQLLKEHNLSVEQLVPQRKDWNDDLTLGTENAQGLAMEMG